MYTATTHPHPRTLSVVHLSVERASVSFYDMLRRNVYVTPTSFLELLSSFKALLTLKSEEVDTKRTRLQVVLGGEA